MGDVYVGEKVNIGVGMIICNYDGVMKYKIIIGKNVFIGFNIMLVVLVIVGDDVMMVSGFVIIKNVGEGVLVLVCVE